MNRYLSKLAIGVASVALALVGTATTTAAAPAPAPAVENAYGTTGVWPSAIAHWRGAINAGKAHPGDWNAPRGAFVYWNTSQYGHVGIFDGNGGFYSSSVGGAIGHRGNKNYFVNYLGWSKAQVPA